MVGGTGLYLTRADPAGWRRFRRTPPAIRATADARIASGGLAAMVAELDPRTRAQIDLANPVRVQRAWEVLTATGRGIAEWQDDTPPPLLAPDDCQRVLITSDRDWLADRIAARFHAMLDQGAPGGGARDAAPVGPGRAMGQGHRRARSGRPPAGSCDLAEATERAIIASRQYAKAQRVWFRGRMRDWQMWQAGNAGLIHGLIPGNPYGVH